jgi:NADH-quinone oxidoreductase subunit J
MLLKAEFLAIVLVLVYVGAVMVLFLFVVMMLDIDMAKLRAGIWGNLPFAVTIGAVIALEMAAVLVNAFISQPEPAASNIGDTKALGKLIYTHYLYPFEIASIILLAAMVAAVALTLRRRKDRKYFDPGMAVKTQRNDRVRIVSMPSESNRASAADGAASEKV